MEFTWLRLILAYAVLVAHFEALTGNTIMRLSFSSTIAVQAFFVVSGWIVTASYLGSRTGLGFFVRRISRLYPLYAFVILAQVAGVLAIAGPDRIDFQEIARYLAANLIFANFLSPTLFGYFESSAVPEINPSLWTLKIEVAYYLSVPMLVYAIRDRKVVGLWMVFLCSTIFHYVFILDHPEIAKQFPGQLRFFVAGMLLRHYVTAYHEPLSRHPLRVLAFGMVGVLLAHWLEHNFYAATLQPVWVGVFVTSFAIISPKASKAPDISYGIYLVHAPLIHFLEHFGLLLRDAAGLALVSATAVLVSVVVHYVVELPGIRVGASLSKWIDSRASATVVVR